MQVATSSFRERPECMRPPAFSPTALISFDSMAMWTSSKAGMSTASTPSFSMAASALRMAAASALAMIPCFASMTVWARSTSRSAGKIHRSACTDEVKSFTSFALAASRPLRNMSSFSLMATRSLYCRIHLTSLYIILSSSWTHVPARRTGRNHLINKSISNRMQRPDSCCPCRHDP